MSEIQDAFGPDVTPAQVVAVARAAQWCREESQQLIGMDDPFGSQGPPILIGANAYFALADALAALSGENPE